MKTIELFSGTESFSQVMRKHGHETFTVENDPQFSPSLLADIMEPVVFPYVPRILWASPPCEGFSVAAIGANWTGGFRGYEPKSDTARRSIALAKRTIELVRESGTEFYFIENPRGLLRKMPFMEEFLLETGGVRHTVWYCRYGDTRAKPTDIFTNAWWWKPREVCHNGNPDHERAPRGAKTGTQGVKGYRDRSRIPAALFEEILAQMPTL